MAPNEKCGFHGKVEFGLVNTCKRQLFDENLAEGGSMCGHFCLSGLA
jgi:hypothetical protein